MAPPHGTQGASGDADGAAVAKRLAAVVDGEVQEIGFRAALMKVARRLKLRGFVENLEDGRVRIVAEGAESALDELLGVIRSGRLPGTVQRVDAEWSDAGGGLPFFKVKIDDLGAELFQGFGTAGALLGEVALGVASVNTEAAKVGAEVAKVNVEVKKVGAEVAMVRTEVAKVGSEVVRVGEKVDAVGLKVEGAGEAVMNMHGDMNQRFDRLDANYGQIGEVAVSIRDEVRRLNDAVAEQYTVSNRLIENNNEALRQVSEALRGLRTG
jgi:acylphosphatase